MSAGRKASPDGDAEEFGHPCQFGLESIAHIFSFYARLKTELCLQSAIFGPALNGSIPELFPAGYVTKANALLP